MLAESLICKITFFAGHQPFGVGFHGFGAEDSHSMPKSLAHEILRWAPPLSVVSLCAGWSPKLAESLVFVFGAGNEHFGVGFV